MLYFYRVCKDLKAKQAKQSMDSSKSVNSDKTIKNKQERDRYEKKYITRCLLIHMIQTRHENVHRKFSLCAEYSIRSIGHRLNC